MRLRDTRTLLPSLIHSAISIPTTSISSAALPVFRFYSTTFAPSSILAYLICQMTPPTEVRCHCSCCAGRVWRCNSAAYRAHQKSCTASRPGVPVQNQPGPNATSSLNNPAAENPIGKQRSSLDPHNTEALLRDHGTLNSPELAALAKKPTKCSNLTSWPLGLEIPRPPSTEVPQAKSFLTHLDISHGRTQANQNYRKETGSHFQPHWDGEEVDSGEYR